MTLSVEEGHLDENVLARHVGGEATEAERAGVAEHIDACDRCRELVSALVRTLVTPEGDRPSWRLLSRGTNLGRYVLLDPVGRGGMGVVYGAFDPELDRKVAIKFLRPGRGASPAAARPQLLAEAQAIARLSHPNIVTVHDVGTFDGEVFFAMEYVKGETLRRAQRPGLAGLQHTLALYTAAGQGLAAAHQAGIVHGDFKPENVLVGDDGRVRVTDFGLARAVHEHTPRFAGTPAYMAPEHWQGLASDVRSDQYSFCLALLEAVEGQRPEEVEDASPSQPPEPVSLRRRTLPARLSRVLGRGLATDPAQRWPSMDALLDALREARLPFRRSTGLLTAALLVATATVWVQHVVWERRVDHELAAAAARLPELLRAQSERTDLLVQAGLRAEGVLGALGQASNMDAALGLAEDESREHQLAEAHEILRSADLPGLKSRDALLVANAWGRVVLNLAAPDSFGAPAPAVPLLMETMEGTATDGLWSWATLDRLGLPLVSGPRTDDLLLLSGRPVVRGRSIVGLVLTGRWVDTGLLEELGRAVGAQVVLHAPDGGWAGARWPVAPPLERVVQMQVGGTTIRVLGFRLGAEGTRTPAGEAYVLRMLTPGEIGGLGSAWLRWGLLVISLAVLAWLGWLTRRSGWYLRAAPRASTS
ncbi:MAG TPA: serine/threonine-protein kinase [Myxococcaceae bacterium]|nr:serine/threonine-protein kinase [Myxococcaceae bacterium]